MLHPIAELAKNNVGYIERVLSHEIDSDTLRSDQSNDLLNLIKECRRGIVKKEVRLVEEEDKLWFIRISELRQSFEELGQEPEQERERRSGRLQQAVGGEYVDHSAAIAVRLDQVIERQSRLPVSWLPPCWSSSSSLL